MFRVSQKLLPELLTHSEHGVDGLHPPLETCAPLGATYEKSNSHSEVTRKNPKNLKITPGIQQKITPGIQQTNHHNILTHKTLKIYKGGYSAQI